MTTLPLRAALRAEGLTLSDLTRGLGLHPSTASNWTRGVRAPDAPTRAAVNAWLERHGINPTAAWGEADDPPHRPVAGFFRSSATPPPTPDLTPDPEEDLLMMPRETLDLSLLDHFHLPEDPFDDVGEPFRGASWAKAEAALTAAVTKRQWLCVTAPPGAGKSTLQRAFTARLRRMAQVRLIVPRSLDRRHVTPETLAVAILRDLTGETSATWDREARATAVERALQERHERGDHTALVIDEAHDLTVAALIALKRTWDTDMHRLFAIVLLGQPPLRERIMSGSALTEVRLRARFLELRPYNAGEVGQYLTWRWAALEAGTPPFSQCALKVLAQRAGWPAAINNLAAAGLIKAWRAGDALVTSAHLG